MSREAIKIFMFVFCMIFVSFANSAFAEDVAIYSGEQYLGCRNIGDTRVFLNDPNDYGTVKDGFVYLPNGCSSLPQVAPKYLKQVGGAIEEMNVVEKAAIDILEGQAEQAARDARDSRLEVSQEKALIALVQVINVRLPAGQKITKQELVDKIKANK